MGKLTKLGILHQLLIFNVGIGFAHGEQKAGPHGGSIMMPGAFHTELVVDKTENIARIYLLDMAFKDATTKASEVEVHHVSNQKTTELTCKKMTDFFECRLNKSLNFESGKLSIKSKRSGISGVEINYQLPLSLGDAAPH